MYQAPVMPSIPVRNPRSGQFDYELIPPSQEELKSLCQGLRAGQKNWQSQGLEQRIAALQAWRSEILARQDELVKALTLDTGRKAESILEAELLANSIERWCGLARDFFAEKVHKKSAIPFIEIHQELSPFALVGVISPWNFPLLLSIIDAIPALLAGSAVVVKPSEVTPRFIAVIQASIDAVPDLAKVFAYIEGAGETGSHLLEEVDLVCFTGSVATGKKVYAACAERFIPCFLELGGKDPALVFEGADLDRAATAILWGSVVNCGHSCLSIERVYVQASVFDAFLKLISEKAQAIKLAYPGVDDGQIGPVISDRQVAIIDEHLKDALEQGATLHTGNPACQQLSGGWYCRPTVLSNVAQGAKIIQEETFGPIIPVIPFEAEAEAIALANGTQFGLSAAVFAKTWEEAERIGQHIEAGAISINDCALTAIVHEGEKQSFKLSGIGGTRMGPAAIKRFMRQKAFIINKPGVRDPWWF
jgi:succinate-semialdehyde dehydrogenase / glutarate-semialdehyde dehydrogenase